MKQMHMPESLASTLRWRLAAQSKVKKARSGFTLLELLVALVIGGIITTLILGFTVDLMRNNQREAARSDTQREIQGALDYINRDVREAVYVYDGDCLRSGALGLKVPPGAPAGTPACPALLQYLPNELNAANNLPVLAFWRLDPIPEQLQDVFCPTPAALQPQANPRNAVPCAGRKMYTLVVYSINNANQGIWQGRSRITRYTLPQFIAGSGTPTQGWESPLERGFANWPRDPGQPPNAVPTVTGGQAALGGRNQVLVDFVDDRLPTNNAQANSPNVCPSINGVAPQTAGGFYATPASDGGYAAAADLSRRTFYACVRGAEASNFNQEVIVRIQGNAAGQPGLRLDQNSVPITMETRILTRGVLGKT